jgi:hypothetical protein
MHSSGIEACSTGFESESWRTIAMGFVEMVIDFPGTEPVGGKD